MKELPYKTAYKDLREDLLALYPQGEASAISRMVMEELTGITVTTGLLSDVALLDLQQVSALSRIKSALLKQEPLQYVLGYADFLDFRLAVNPAVLIPRPETEELANWVIKDQQGTALKHPTTILDIGTGSGCLALAAKSSFPAADVFALDVSADALAVARTNAEKYHLDISFLRSDILQDQPEEVLPGLDVVVSNPPYIMPAERTAMLPNVLHYEPHSALFVTNGDPLQFYKAIERFCRSRMKAGGSIYLELNAGQATSIEDYYRSRGWETVLKADFQGLPRMLKAFRRRKAYPTNRRLTSE